jgi:hypothetical protein
MDKLAANVFHLLMPDKGASSRMTRATSYRCSGIHLARVQFIDQPGGVGSWRPQPTLDSRGRGCEGAKNAMSRGSCRWLNNCLKPGRSQVHDEVSSASLLIGYLIGSGACSSVFRACEVGVPQSHIRTRRGHGDHRLSRMLPLAWIEADLPLSTGSTLSRKLKQ